MTNNVTDRQMEEAQETLAKETAKEDIIASEGSWIEDAHEHGLEEAYISPSMDMLDWI